MATVQLTEKNFQDVIESNDIVLIDYWAPWCGPCRAFGPVFEKASDKHPEVVFGKVNTEEERGLAEAFAIRSIPTLMIFRQKVLVFAQPGMLPANVLEDLVEQVKALDMDKIRKEIADEEARKTDEAQPAAAAAG